MKFAKRVELTVLITPSPNEKDKVWHDGCVNELDGRDSFTMNSDIKSPPRTL